MCQYKRHESFVMGECLKGNPALNLCDDESHLGFVFQRRLCFTMMYCRLKATLLEEKGGRPFPYKLQGTVESLPFVWEQLMGKGKPV